MATGLITQERLKSLLTYDPDTGEFCWRAATAIRTKVGSVAGTVSNRGYTRIQIDRRIYLAHRLAWLYTYGEWPKGVVDHINQNKSDNRLNNLRDVSLSVNARNCKLQKNNSSGYKGVSYWTHRRKWAAQIRTEGKNKLLGMFDTPTEAANAYACFARKCGMEV
jgi:hypothetical protein